MITWPYLYSILIKAIYVTITSSKKIRWWHYVIVDGSHIKSLALKYWLFCCEGWFHTLIGCEVNIDRICNVSYVKIRIAIIISNSTDINIYSIACPLCHGIIHKHIFLNAINIVDSHISSAIFLSPSYIRKWNWDIPLSLKLEVCSPLDNVSRCVNCHGSLSC